MLDQLDPNLTALIFALVMAVVIIFGSWAILAWLERDQPPGMYPWQDDPTDEWGHYDVD